MNARKYNKYIDINVNIKNVASLSSILSALVERLTHHLPPTYFDAFCGTWYTQNESSLPHLLGQIPWGSSSHHTSYFYHQGSLHLRAMTKNMQGSDSYMSWVQEEQQCHTLHK